MAKAGNAVQIAATARAGSTEGRARAGARARPADPNSQEHHLGLRVAPAPAAPQWCSRTTQGIEGSMATRQHRQIIETPTEARQAEPGPSVLALLTVSTGLAVLILGMIWFVFFRT
jgi:hypothetical protein